MGDISISNEEILMILDFAIKWVPTILFGLIVLGHTLTGFRRGFRKSMILLINSIVVGGICIGLYFFFVNTKIGDRFLLNIINLFLGGEGALQKMLGIDTTIDTLTLVIVEILTSEIFSYGEAVGVVIKDNGAYLAVIVNLVYHISFALVLYIVYLLLIFVLYIFYLLFNSERVHKKRVFRKFQRYEADGTYRKRRIYGSIVGLCRGLFSGIMTLSMIGSLLYVVSAGKGDQEYKDIDFGNETYNTIYKGYQTIGSYGTDGVYKVLNVVQNEEEVPYYLLLTDIILQGKYTEEDINGFVQEEYSLVIREELATYTKFLLDSVNVVLKYKEDTVIQFVNGEIESEDLINELTMLFNNPEFQYDFTMLIQSFNDDTYFFNFALSLVDAVVSNIDNPSLGMGLDDVATGAIKSLFSGKPVSAIETEQYIIETGFEVDLPHIDPSKVLDKADVTLLLGMIFTLMEADMTNAYEIFDSTVVIIKQLSIFKTSRKDEINPALARFYNYIETVLLGDLSESISPFSADVEDEDTIKNRIYAYINGLNNSDVDWIYEINTLLDVVPDVYTLSEAFTNASVDGLDGLVSIFDDNNENYEEIYNAYANVKETLVNSKMIGKVLKSNVVATTLVSILSEISPSYTMPIDIVYENQYIGDVLIETGELYNLLNCFENLILSGTLEELLSAAGSMQSFNDLADVLSILSEPNDEGLSAIDYIFESKIFTSVMSAILIDFANEEGSILFVADLAKETDNSGNTINIIKAEYLKETLVCFPQLIEELEPLLNGSEDINISQIINGETLTTLLENPLIEGTVANIIVSTFEGNEAIVIPERLKDINNWVVSGDSELDKLLNCIEVLDLDFANLDVDKITNQITNFTENEIRQLFESDILYCSLSNIIFTSLGDYIIVPNTCRKNIPEVVIDKEVLIDLLLKMKLILGIEFETRSSSDVLEYIISYRESFFSNDILIATASYIFNQVISETLTVPESLIVGGEKENLQIDFNNNPWKHELSNLFDALDEIFSLSQGNKIYLNEMINKIYKVIYEYEKYSKINTKYTRLEVVLNSNIIKYNISLLIEQFLTDKVIDPTINEAAKEYLNASKVEKVYQTIELKSLLDMLQALGLLKENGFAKIDFSSIEFGEKVISMFETEANIYLIRGVLSKQISQIIAAEGSGLKEHPAAYDFDYKMLLNHREIISILEITKDSISGFDKNSFVGEDIKLDQYLSYIQDENGECKSYLITATISDFIIKNSEKIGIVIPEKAAYKTTQIIDHKELYLLLSYLTNITNGGTLSSIKISGDFVLDEKLFECVILNASILKGLSFGEEIGLFAIQDEVIVSKDIVTKATIYFLSEKGYKSLCKAMKTGFPISTMSNNSLSFDYVCTLSHDQISVMIDSGIIRLAINEIIREKYEELPSYVKLLIDTQFNLEKEKIRVFDLSSPTGKTELKEVYKKESIITAIEALKYAASLY